MIEFILVYMATMFLLSTLSINGSKLKETIIFVISLICGFYLIQINPYAWCAAMGTLALFITIGLICLKVSEVKERKRIKRRNQPDHAFDVMQNIVWAKSNKDKGIIESKLIWLNDEDKEGESK